MSEGKIKTGIFGGSFDPVHLGHVELVRRLKEREGLDQVLLLPAYVSPWKQDRMPASPPERISMLRLAFRDMPYVSVSDFETSQNRSCYSYDTLHALQRLHPEWEIFFIVGRDQAENLGNWYRGEELLKQFRFLSSDRLFDISSTRIRAAIGEGLSAEQFLPAAVWDYIRSHGLYALPGCSFYDELDRFVKGRLKESRYAHTMGVVGMAEELSVRYGADPWKARIAAVFHDAFREKGNLEHGAAAADYLKEHYRFTDPEILDAIRWHTTGRPGMCLLEKILKIADNLEPGRVFPGVEELRSSISDNVDETLLMLMKHTRDYVLSVGGTYAVISNLAIEELERK